MVRAIGERDRWEGGFTLLEVAVALAVALSAAVLAYAQMGTFARSDGPSPSARLLQMTMKKAHWGAMASGRRIRIRLVDEGRGRWRCLAEKEEGGRWSHQEEYALPGGDLRITSTGPAWKIFNPDGTCSFGGYLVEGRSGSYRLTLQPATGRVRLIPGREDGGA